MFRSNAERLLALQRCFLQNNIESRYKISESKNRQRPILFISKLEDINIFIETYDIESVSFDDNWNIFINVKKLVVNKSHKTLAGLEEIML